MRPRRPGGRMHAATTSGPAQAPRPASSAPATQLEAGAGQRGLVRRRAGRRGGRPAAAGAGWSLPTSCRACHDGPRLPAPRPALREQPGEDVAEVGRQQHLVGRCAAASTLHQAWPSTVSRSMAVSAAGRGSDGLRHPRPGRSGRPGRRSSPAQDQNRRVRSTAGASSGEVDVACPTSSTASRTGRGPRVLARLDPAAGREPVGACRRRCARG